MSQRERERESCNSRHFSWLMKSCFPNPNDTTKCLSRSQQVTTPIPIPTTISSLPEDLLLECLSRVPSTSFPSLFLVCRRWSTLLLSPSFSNLRRHHYRLQSTVFALYASGSSLAAANLSLEDFSSLTLWKQGIYLPTEPLSNCFGMGSFQGFYSQARLAAIGPSIFLIGKNATLQYDAWTTSIISRSPMLSPRKKFACTVISRKIYVAGGSSTTQPQPTVDEYDPHTDTWRVVSHAPRRRYGCLGASVDGVFYIIGGLKICAATAGTEAHVYASSMDLFDVHTGAWLRSRTVPGGGCVVAACAARGHVYVLTSHAVELSFWRLDARRNSSGFGEWSRIRRPPFPPQVRLDNTVKFSCVGAGDNVVLVQVVGCIDDLLSGGARIMRGLKEGLVLLYDTVREEWKRGPDLPSGVRRAAVVNVEC